MRRPVTVAGQVHCCGAWCHLLACKQCCGFADKIRNGEVVKQLLKQHGDAVRAVEALYTRCLTREPTSQEREQLSAVLETSDDPEQVLEEVFWALLNSKEFLFNH